MAAAGLGKCQSFITMNTLWKFLSYRDESIYPYILLPALENKHGLCCPHADFNVLLHCYPPCHEELGRVLRRRLLLSTCTLHSCPVRRSSITTLRNPSLQITRTPSIVERAATERHMRKGDCFRRPNATQRQPKRTDTFRKTCFQRHCGQRPILSPYLSGEA